MVPATKDRPVEVELVTAAHAVVPGETTWVAVRLKPNHSWHTYWRYAGDVGSAPSVVWNLPSGWNAGTMEWTLSREAWRHRPPNRWRHRATAADVMP